MFLRFGAAIGAFMTILAATLAADCIRAMMFAGDGMLMASWLERYTGLPCDIRSMVGLLVLTVIGAAVTVYLWAASTGDA
jgi:hypothetical protein